ncbi:MAG: PAS domain-containing protein [Terriglobales bacterium]
MSGHLPSLLLVGTDDALRASQATLFRRRKYKVSETTPSDAIVALASAFDIAVLNHTIPPAKRQKIADSIKKHTPDKLVLVLHASGGLRARNVDAAVDSRNGGDAILKALDHLVLMKAVRDHNHTELADKCVVVVDKDRHYTFVSDGVCELLGYSRAELIGRQIEEISLERRPKEVEAQFQEFVKDGTMEGEFTLRRRSGEPIRIWYSARVQPDGCLMAVWRPN